MADSDWQWTPTITNPAIATPAPGQTRAEPEAPRRIGRFTILRLLGRGGMGNVYVGYDEQLDRKVAVKLLRARIPSAAAELRLRREAQALARLSHPNVVQVHEVGDEQGTAFVAMELVDGQTLSEWAREQSDWRARLQMLVQAGRGLAAAHAAGLVHRDFKPDNVLVGRDGRARVLDFGLVRSVANEALTEDEQRMQTEDSLDLVVTRDAEPSRSAETPHAVLHAHLTARSTVMGTPAYMAPEQHGGRPCDASADQFGFCVSAFELLFGRRPYAGDHMHALARAKLDGDIEAIPSDSPVARVVREAILRGLAPEPGARWPSMDALLEQLERGGRRPRSWRAVLIASAALAVALGFGLRASDSRAACRIDERALAGVWDEPRRLALRDAYRRSDASPAAYEQAARDLESWTERWLATRTSSCRATRIQATQSTAMLDRREACLGRQLAQFDAQLGVLIEADERGILRTPELLAELPDLGACSVEALDANAEAALEPELRVEVDAEFRALARARAQLRVGRPKLARTLAERALERGCAWDHAPLWIDAQAALAKLDIDAGRLGEGLELLRQATLAAEREGLLELVASLRVELARAAAGDFAQPVLERWMIDEAELALARVGRADDPREVTLEVARARVLEQAGDHEAALAAHTHAYELSAGRLDDAQRASLRIGIGTAHYRAGNLEVAREELDACVVVLRQHWGPWAPDVAQVEFNLGVISSDLGDFELARSHLAAAVAADERLWGTTSLEVARDRFALAYLGFATGELDRACTLSQAVLRTYLRELGREHDETAAALTSVGLCRYHAGDFTGALGHYRDALAIQRALLGEHDFEVGLLHSNIAEVELARGHHELAREGFERARAIFAEQLPANHSMHAFPLAGLGRVALAAGDPGTALAALARALELADASQAVDLAEIRLALAGALIEIHGEAARELAIGLGHAALSTFEHASIERRAGAARAWLDSTIIGSRRQEPDPS